MQTPKARSSPSGTPQKDSSPSEASQKVSPRVVRQLRTGPRYSEHTASSANLLSKAPKERSPKVVDHKSPKSPITEKKRSGRVSELENQICQLEKDLKVVKDQLCSTEEQKKLAQRDAEESNEQLLALSLKLEESQKQQTPSDSAALASALDEIERLKSVAESEAVCSKNSESELRKLKEDLSETLSLVEDMKNQLSDSKESEWRAQKLVEETLTQLETAKEAVETLRSDGLKAAEAFNALTSELDQSRARVVFLEELEADSHSEVDQLRSALEAAELRYNDERARNEREMRNALETVERMKFESGERESELTKSKHEVEELKANLMDKETELQGICEENEGLSVKLETTLSGQREIELEKEIENLRAGLAEKEAENEKLKSEMKETSKGSVLDHEMESALVKIGYLTEEVEKGNKKAVRAGEELEAAQVAKAEMEGELRRMKVQSDQWRKAAEAAASMISGGGQQVMERTGSMDSHYSSPKVSSPYGDDLLDDDLMKKKNANMLRRLGVLWKKQQK